jgi:hypothetical protein
MSFFSKLTRSKPTNSQKNQLPSIDEDSDISKLLDDCPMDDKKDIAPTFSTEEWQNQVRLTLKPNNI